MAFVLIVALLTATVTLGLIVYTQSKSIRKYEEALTKKARKAKNANK